MHHSITARNPPLTSVQVYQIPRCGCGQGFYNSHSPWIHNQTADEAERSLHDALSVLSQTVKETRTVLGGECSEMLISCAVEEEACKIKGMKTITTERLGVR